MGGGRHVSHFGWKKWGVERSDDVGVPPVNRLVAGGRWCGRVQSIHGEVRSGRKRTAGLDEVQSTSGQQRLYTVSPTRQNHLA